MNIALVTNKKLHHKYWSSQLYLKNNVRLIIHPTGIQEPLLKKIKKKRLFHYGAFYFILKIVSVLCNKIFKAGLTKSNNRAEREYFSQYEKQYDKIPKSMIHEVKTVNSKTTLKLIKENKIDIICFLGGDVAKKEFINSAKICLNYHSGTSPFYNGTKTNYHAVSDFRPNFVGGTLMKMNERIDGGEILMHYLCPIKGTDRAEDLFMKGIIGSVKVYQEFLDKYKDSAKGISQRKSFKYVRNIDWTIINDIRLKKFYKNNRMKIYEREESIIDYVNKDYSLEDLYRISLKKILA
ncbi:MAG: hypothetical protein JXR05_13535 [Flavobacteriaceae bacterium]